MAEQHRATAQQWLGMEVDRGTLDCFAVASTILELRDRIEALEATTQPAKPKPDSSLVERVAAAIHPNVCADPNLYLHEARAAIREVEAWLLKHYGGPTAITCLLEEEAEQ